MQQIFQYNFSARIPGFLQDSDFLKFEIYEEVLC